MRLIDADDVDNHIVGSVNLSGCPTINAIPIPEDATNGDVIKAMFPNIEREDNYGDADYYLLNGKSAYTPKLITFKSWWNAKYKGVE